MPGELFNGLACNVHDHRPHRWRVKHAIGKPGGADQPVAVAQLLKSEGTLHVAGRAVVILKHGDDSRRSLAQGQEGGMIPPLDFPGLMGHLAVVQRNGLPHLLGRHLGGGGADVDATCHLAGLLATMENPHTQSWPSTIVQLQIAVCQHVHSTEVWQCLDGLAARCQELDDVRLLALGCGVLPVWR